MLIQAMDKKLYKNPIILGLGCEVSFDSDYGYIIVKRGKRVTEESFRSVANRMLKTLHVRYRNLVKEEESSWLLDGEFLPGIKFRFDLLGPIPVPCERRYEFCTDMPMPGTSWLAWELPFDTDLLYEIYTKEKGNQIPVVLIQLVTGLRVVPKPEKYRVTLKVKIAKYHPRFVEMIKEGKDLESIIKEVGPILWLRRKKN